MVEVENWRADAGWVASEVTDDWGLDRRVRKARRDCRLMSNRNVRSCWWVTKLWSGATEGDTVEVVAEVVWMQSCSRGVWDECDYGAGRAVCWSHAGMEPHAVSWCLSEVGKEIQTLEHSGKRNLIDAQSKMYMDKRSRNLRRKMWLKTSEEADFDYWRSTKNEPAQEFQRDHRTEVVYVSACVWLTAAEGEVKTEMGTYTTNLPDLTSCRTRREHSRTWLCAKVKPLPPPKTTLLLIPIIKKN